MDLALHNFVYDRPNLSNILRDHQDLGAHTNIIDFQPGRISTFMWIHAGLRPMGVGISKQCLDCKRFKTLHPTVNSEYSEIDITCSACDKSRKFTFPAGWKWTQKPPVKGDERGAWLVKVEEHILDGGDETNMN